MNKQHLLTVLALGLTSLGCESESSGETDAGETDTDGPGAVASGDPPTGGGTSGSEPSGGTSASSTTTTGASTAATTSSDPGAPQIISFSTNVTTITDGESVTFSAVVTDPDGIDDLIGGTIENETGAVFGSFTTTAQEGAYSLSLSWAQIDQVETIEFPVGGGPSRTFVARFFDQSALETVAEVAIELSCEGLAACDGTCVDTQDSPNHCGGCGIECETGRDCCSGSCTELSTDAQNCGTCGSECDGYCEYGYCYEDYGSTGEAYSGEDRPGLDRVVPIPAPGEGSHILHFSGAQQRRRSPDPERWNFGMP